MLIEQNLLYFLAVVLVAFALSLSLLSVWNLVGVFLCLLLPTLRPISKTHRNYRAGHTDILEYANGHWEEMTSNHAGVVVYYRNSVGNAFGHEGAPTLQE